MIWLYQKIKYWLWKRKRLKQIAKDDPFIYD